MDSQLPAGRVAEGTTSKGESLGLVMVGQPGQNAFLHIGFLTLLPFIKDDFVKLSKALQWSVTGHRTVTCEPAKCLCVGISPGMGLGLPSVLGTAVPRDQSRNVFQRGYSCLFSLRASHNSFCMDIKHRQERQKTEVTCSSDIDIPGIRADIFWWG